MVKTFDKNAQRMKRHTRVRGKISGTPERPRLNVYRSNANIYAQIIDDVNGVTLAAASSVEKDFEGATGNKEAARKVGKLVAERAKAKGIDTVVFDRGGYIYHGRVAELAGGGETMAYNRDRAPKEDNAPEFIEKVVYLNRVSKTVKGGRVMKFSALVVVGDGKGTVGYGLGKAAEVSEAILKGIADAKKNMVKITLDGTTIPHDVIGIYGAGKVMLKPAPVGTGIIAGGAVRAVMEAVGISNIRAKCLRSNNPQNVVKATMQGLMSLRDAAEVARIRGKSVEEIVG